MKNFPLTAGFLELNIKYLYNSYKTLIVQYLVTEIVVNARICNSFYSVEVSKHVHSITVIITDSLN